VSRFIKAGLVGNDGYDRAREEARIRGKENNTIPKENELEPSLAIQVFIPRTVTSKTQKASDVTIQSNSHVKIMEQPQKVHESLTKDLPFEDPLITGFYEQIERQAGRKPQNSVNSVNSRNSMRFHEIYVVKFSGI
jgi:hypothetical protein